MKIERINENQIRCTLTREDLVSRHLKLSELAYGSTKARELFREMMEQASYQCGFDAEDIPLMIEAIPLSSESLILLVTKVESPDELDTRFSRFSEDNDEVDDDFDGSEVSEPKRFNNKTADEILNMVNDFLDKAKDVIKSDPESAAKAGIPVDITKMFVFNNLDDIITLSPMLSSFYTGKNSLYKSPSDGLYYLVVSKTNDEPAMYNKLCNILAEYGDQSNFVVGEDKYMNEHYEVLVSGQAIQTLGSL